MQKLKHLLEAALFLAVYGAFRALPLDAASWAGGALLHAIGPRTKLDRVARRNLELAFPEKSSEERDAIRLGMWRHLGRVVGEFAHLRTRALSFRISYKGLENLPQAGTRLAFVSGHFGNWELFGPMGRDHGVPLTLVYREANNPYLERLIARVRGAHAESLIPKGPQGAMRIISAIKQKQALALLVDQKMNEGVAVPFFGRDAMTAPAVAQFALRFGTTIVPSYVVRTQGCHFQAAVLKPLAIAKTGNDEADIHAILTQLNRMMEGWIRAHPEQWLWVHRRWDKQEYEAEMPVRDAA